MKYHLVEGAPRFYQVLSDNGLLIGTLEQEVDGYYYYWPVAHGGFWQASIMREIANKLDEINKAWDTHLSQVLKELTSPSVPFQPEQ